MSVEIEDVFIKFHTTEDKDGDTHVTVTVEDVMYNIVAKIDNDFGHFVDNSDTDRIKLETFNKSSKDDLLNGFVTIRIDPNGNDTWRFNFSIVFVFNDQSKLAGVVNNIELTQNNRQQTFSLHGIINQ